MTDKQLVYDTGDPRIQWRCGFYTLMKPGNLLVVPIVFLFGLMFHAQLPVILTCCLLSVVSLILPLAFVTYARTRHSRICTTTIGEAGIRDVTPDTNKWLSWDKVSKIEMCEGDIYFFTLLGGGVFIPVSAFPSLESAQQFFENAQALRASARGRNGILTLDNSHTALIEEKEREEEAMWKALEDRHKKEKSSDSKKG